MGSQGPPQCWASRPAGPWCRPWQGLAAHLGLGPPGSALDHFCLPVLLLMSIACSLPPSWASSPCFPAHTPGRVTELSLPPPLPATDQRPRGCLVLPPGRAGLQPSAQLPPFSRVCAGVGFPQKGLWVGRYCDQGLQNRLIRFGQK